LTKTTTRIVFYFFHTWSAVLLPAQLQCLLEFIPAQSFEKRGLLFFRKAWKACLTSSV